jgi:hypothetical protein
LEAVVIGSECLCRGRRVEGGVRVLIGAVTTRCAEEKDRRGKSVEVSFRGAEKLRTDAKQASGIMKGPWCGCFGLPSCG